MMNLNGLDAPTTWLFRDMNEELSDLIGELHARGPANPAIASVGSSTGEEVYSLIALLDEAGMTGAKVTGYEYNADLLARSQDLSLPVGSTLRSLEKEGVFLKGDDLDRLRKLLSAYFDTDLDQTTYMYPKVRDAYLVGFEKADITTAPVPESDVVVCRNLAIYSENDAKRLKAIYENLGRSVADGGILVIDNKSRAMFENVPEIRKALEKGYGPPKVSRTGSVYRRK